MISTIQPCRAAAASLANDVRWGCTARSRRVCDLSGAESVQPNVSAPEPAVAGRRAGGVDAPSATRHGGRRRDADDLARTGAAIDRNLAAFENGILDPEDLADRLASLKARSRQLATRRDELASQIASVPAMPPPATLRQVADHIGEIIGSGSHTQQKALIEALVAKVKITDPGRIVPVFRIPQATGTGQASRSEMSDVRATTNLVGLTCQHPNPRVGTLVTGPEIVIRSVRTRQVGSAAARPGRGR
jgi:hypothetical protein